MDKEKLKILAKKIASNKDRVTTEEATKNVFIIPFFQGLREILWV